MKLFQGIFKMRYCEFSDKSDLFIRTTSTHIICVHVQNKNFTTNKHSELIEHIEEHIKNGDKIPDGLIDKLKKERSTSRNCYIG